MPFIFLILGIMLVTTGVRDTQGDFFNLVKSDFAGNGTIQNSFLAWLLAIGVIGGLGYYKPLKPLSDGFLLLVIVVLFLSNKGVFSQLESQLGIGNQVNQNNPFTQFNLAGVAATQGQLSFAQPTNPSLQAP